MDDFDVVVIGVGTHRAVESGVRVAAMVDSDLGG